MGTINPGRFSNKAADDWAEDRLPGFRQSYLGFASARGLIHDNVGGAGTAQQIKTRTMDFARANMKHPRPVVAVGWYVSNAGVEVVQGGTYRLQCAIEYPLGSAPVRLTYGGNQTGTFQGGDTAVPDAPNIAIPAGALFVVHYWMDSPSGYCYHNQWPALPGDNFTQGASVPDLSSGYLAGSASPGAYVGICHLGVIDMITQPADLDIGDSIAQGSGTDGRDFAGVFGVLARVTRDRHGGCNAGRSSTRASQFTTANRPRTIALAQYASRVKSNFGINDALSSTASSAIAAEIVRIRAIFANKKFYQTTITPITNGNGTAHALPDGSDQVLNAPATTIVNALNLLIRGGLQVNAAPSIDGVLDVRAVVEHPVNSDKWLFGATTDGIHPKPNAYRRIGAAVQGKELLSL